MPVSDRIKAIVPLEQKEKQEAYIVLVDELIGANSVDGLVQLARHRTPPHARQASPSCP